MMTMVVGKGELVDYDALDIVAKRAVASDHVWAECCVGSPK